MRLIGNFFVGLCVLIVAVAFFVGIAILLILPVFVACYYVATMMRGEADAKKISMAVVVVAILMGIIDLASDPQNEGRFTQTGLASPNRIHPAYLLLETVLGDPFHFSKNKTVALYADMRRLRIAPHTDAHASAWRPLLIRRWFGLSVIALINTIFIGLFMNFMRIERGIE